MLETALAVQDAISVFPRFELHFAGAVAIFEENPNDVRSQNPGSVVLSVPKK